MSKPDPSRGLGRALKASGLLLLAVWLCGVQAAWAQSGRKAQKPLGLPTADAPKQEDKGAKPAESKKPGAAVSFVVMRYDDNVFGIDPLARDGVSAAFLRRLGQSSSVSVKDGGKGRRQEARTRAKEETEAYVLVFQLDEEAGQMSTVNADSRGLILRTYVYEPKTGDLKYTDTIYQRPYQQTARVGGVRVPVPGRRPERYPSQYELEQAARDAADRVLSRFHISPPDN